jgi:hypothetical protein
MKPFHPETFAALEPPAYLKASTLPIKHGGRLLSRAIEICI